ncbi:MAG: hypothetical protein PHQ00_05375 [Phycisphaerae bacterium]|nr:hypothetical protein [Phycisphaerae bacterium]
MIKTLRITSFLTAVTALGFFVFIAARGMAANEDVEKLLKLPSVAEQFQAGQKPASGEAETPLMKQAKALALRINPPPPPAPSRPVPSAPAAPRPQATVSAKFKLIGTSYHFGDEAGSLALIDEVGKGLHWVKQGGKVGHLIIEKIGDGKVLINDNDKTYELVADREKRPDLVKSYSGTVVEDKPIILWESTESVAGQTESVVPSVGGAETSVQEQDPEELRRQTQENIEWLKQLQQDPNSLGMSDEEAQALSGLGELLKTLESEIEQIDGNSTAITDTNSQAYDEETLEAQQQQIMEEIENLKQEDEPESQPPPRPTRRTRPAR